MNKKIILLLVIVVALHGCKQKTIEAESSEIENLIEEIQEQPSEHIIDKEPSEEIVEMPVDDLPPAPSGTDESELIKAGTFRPVAKSVKGQVKIYRRQIDGEIVMALRSFRTDPGAKLRFYLVENIDDVEAGYPVGGLQNIYGNYEYVIPKNVPIYKYSSVVLYSESTKEIYGEAKLS